MKGVQPPSYARAFLHHVSTHDPPSPALFLPHHPPALFEARSSARPFSARTSRNIRRFTSTSAVSWTTEAWPTSLPKTVATQILSGQFRVNCRRVTVPGQLQADYAHELFAVCESSGCFGLEWSRLNSTGQYLCQEPVNSRTSRITDDGGSADFGRVFALWSG